MEEESTLHPTGVRRLADLHKHLVPALTQLHLDNALVGEGALALGLQNQLVVDRVAKEVVPVGAEAREALLIGRSTHDTAQARDALEEPIDYLAFGPVFGTTSKRSAYDARGLAALAEIAALSGSRPLVAIGGIDRDRVAEAIRAGADAAAVISAVAAATDPVAATRALVTAIEEAR